jgi:hypothetical protein
MEFAFQPARLESSRREQHGEPAASLEGTPDLVVPLLGAWMFVVLYHAWTS